MNLRRAAAAVVALGVLAAGCGGDDDSDARTDDTDTTERSTTSSTTSTTSPTTTTAATGADADVRALAIWPRPSSTVIFSTPEDAARSFALYYAQIREPVLGTYRPGDSTSGEVPILPFPDGGPETRVLVRQVSDGTWYVVGSTTEDITVTEPTVGAEAGLECPQPVAGTALAFEGQVEVRVDAFRPDGSRVEIGRGYVTGSGSPPAAPFSAEIPCSYPTDDVEGVGVLAFWTVSASEEADTLQFVSMPLSLPG